MKSTTLTNYTGPSVASAGFSTNWKKKEKEKKYTINIPSVDYNNDDHKYGIVQAFNDVGLASISYVATNPSNSADGITVSISESEYNSIVIPAIQAERKALGII